MEHPEFFWHPTMPASWWAKGWKRGFGNQQRKLSRAVCKESCVKHATHGTCHCSSICSDAAGVNSQGWQNLVGGLAEDLHDAWSMTCMILAIYAHRLFLQVIAFCHGTREPIHISIFFKSSCFCLQFSSGHDLKRGMKGKRYEFMSCSMRHWCKHNQTYPKC